MAESLHQFELIGERDDIESMVLILLKMYLDVLRWETSEKYRSDRSQQKI